MLKVKFRKMKKKIVSLVINNYTFDNYAGGATGILLMINNR